MSLSTIQTACSQNLCTLMHHFSGDNEQVTCSACSAFLKDVFPDVVEKNFYVPRYFSSFINIHDSSLVMDTK